MNSSPHILQQSKIFQNFWSQFSEQIKSGKGFSDFPSPDDLVPKYVTTVARIPDATAQKIEAVGSAIASKYPAHYLYPATDLHFTFINLDAYFPQGIHEEHTSVMESLQDALRKLPPLKLEARGLGLFPTTIFVQLYDIDGVLEQYRMAINNTIVSSLGHASIENKSVAEHVAFANLIRFRDAPTPDLADEILPFREASFGSFVIPKLELVTTDRLLSKQNTVIHSTYSLNL